MRTRLRALTMPAATEIKATQISEQPMHRGVKVRRLLCNAFTQPIEVGVHARTCTTTV
jgi:hypothetical protein